MTDLLLISRGRAEETGGDGRRRRGLALRPGLLASSTWRRATLGLFLVGALLLSRAGWLRPPLSPDIRALHLSFGLVSGPGPEQVLDGPRRIPADGIGAVLVALSGVGGALALWRPRWGAAVAGVLLAATICGNSAVALNHPALIELLDFEHEQWLQMINVSSTIDEDSLAVASNGRDADVSALNGKLGASETEDGERGDWLRGWSYLQCGVWMLAWTTLGVLYTTRGSLRRRVGVLAAWAALGVGLSGLVCARRLAAEFEWDRAVECEARCDLDGAREALRRALALFPEFDRLERTWILEGALDFQEHRPTPRERFFRATQFAQNQDWDQALALVHDLLAEALGGDPAVKNESTRLLIDTGLSFYLQGERLMSAQSMWRRALAVAPGKRDSAFYLGAVRARTHRSRPDLAEAEFQARLSKLADRVLRADVLATLGDAYFEAGRMEEARLQYMKSCAAYTLPKTINFRALRGLGGL